MKTLVEARRNFYKFLSSVYLETPSHEFINVILDPSFLQGLIETFGNSNSEYLLNFSNDHLSKWISDVCDDIIKKAGTDFYKGIATITNAFIFQDLETLAQQA